MSTGAVNSEFAILGAGALGSILGAHLAHAGHAVVMLARGERARQVNDEGLRLKGLVELTVPVRVLENPRALRRTDVLIVAMKARGTAEALEPLRATSIDVGFSIQNGVMKNELLAAAFGAERIIGALANTSGELLASGEVLFTRNEGLLLGELDGRASARVERIAHSIDGSGVRSAPAPDIRRQEWSKFAAWVGLAALAVTTRAKTWKYLVDGDAALVLVRLVREVGALARASGVELTDESLMPVATICDGSEQHALDLIAAMGAQFRANAPEHRMSTLQDLESRRPLELEETLGHAVRLARERKLALPLLECFGQLVAAIDRIGAG
jgi:2-dehydropantoate 2-reductase